MVPLGKTPLAMLEKSVKEQARSLGVKQTTWTAFTGRLSALSGHCEDTYTHSLRVGLYALEVARNEESANSRLAFMGGLGHDLGKVDVAVGILEAPDLTEGDWTEIRMHPRRGFEMWGEEFLFTGLVAGLHHRLRPQGYGIELPEELAAMYVGLSDASARTAVEATQVVMICDFFDAMTTRRNVRSSADPVKVREMLVQHFGMWPNRVDLLVDTLD